MPWTKNWEECKNYYEWRSIREDYLNVYHHAGRRNCLQDRAD